VPLSGEMWEGALESGFSFPRTLDEWADPHWERVQLRRSADIPWFSKDDRTLMRDLRDGHERLLSDHHRRRLRAGSGTPLLKVLSGWRYRLRFYAGRSS
jgi:hypothetical protein